MRPRTGTLARGAWLQAPAQAARRPLATVWRRWRLPLHVPPHAAGDVDRRAGDVARAVAQQEGDQARHLVGAAHAAERDLLRGETVQELLLRLVWSPPPVDVVPLRRDDEADVDAVHEHAVLRDLHRERLREVVAGGAVDRRGEEGRVRHARVDRTDVDDAAATGLPH